MFSIRTIKQVTPRSVHVVDQCGQYVRANTNNTNTLIHISLLHDKKKDIYMAGYN